MSKSENNSGLIAVIAVVLIGIFGILVYQTQQKTPAEKVADSISQAAEDIGNAAASNK